MGEKDQEGSGQLVAQGPRGVGHAAPTLIPARDAVRFLWGDEQAGYVSDWIHGSSPKIHMMSFAMRPGDRFGNSPDFKTCYDCSETYYCLQGEFTFHCPETGEVHALRAGDVLYFPPRTWHWGYNFGSEECRILESLTPRTEEAVEAYAKRQPWPPEPRYALPGTAGGFVPGAAADAARAVLVRPQDCRSEIVGAERPLRVDIAVSTEMLTTAFVGLYPGQRSEPIEHPGDKVLYALEGQLNVHFPAEAGSWWELQPGDAAFIPGGCRHLFFNTSDAKARFLFSVAPTYR